MGEGIDRVGPLAAAMERVGSRRCDCLRSYIGDNGDKLVINTNLYFSCS